MNLKKMTDMSLLKFSMILAFICIWFRYIDQTLFHIGGNPYEGRYNLLTICVPVVCGLAMFLMISRDKLYNSVTIWGFFFCLYAVTVTCLSGMYGMNQLVYAIFDIIYWFAILYIFYNVMRYESVPKFIYNWSIVLFFVVFITIIINALSAVDTEQYEKQTLLLNSVYYLQFIFPMLLLSKNEKLQTLAVVLLIVATFISNKRGALVITILVALIWVLNRLKNVPIGKKFVLLLVFIVVGLAVYVIIQEITSVFGISLIERMETLSEDGGSGRIRIWTKTFNQISQDDFIYNLMGRGRRSVSLLAEYDHISESHNDALQYLFDYGFVGLILYLGICVSLILQAVKMKKANYKWYLPYIISLAIFFVGSSISMVMVYPYWFVGMAMLWGIILGDFDKEIGNSKTVMRRSI